MQLLVLRTFVELAGDLIAVLPVLALHVLRNVHRMESLDLSTVIFILQAHCNLVVAGSQHSRALKPSPWRLLKCQLPSRLPVVAQNAPPSQQ
mmetsp:Transcript_140581/g.365864  ORF Transcript_140581/g.365864 Transcript_140581/m.365864 type:complete len:92 (-) Transcript_140581:1143-1418(-)